MYRSQNYSTVLQGSLTGQYFHTTQLCLMVSINLYWQETLEESHLSAFEIQAYVYDTIAAGM